MIRIAARQVTSELLIIGGRKGDRGNNKMTEKHLVVAIDWSGPYSLIEARQVAAKDFDGGLYLCLGKQTGQHRVQPQYVGKSTSNLSSRMQEDHHHKLSLVKRNRVVWLGEIVTGNVPGVKKTLTPQSVRLSE